MNNPLVTIRCITYNHEPYIRQCLEGFVMQQTNFKFEAIVHDDASTDGTAAIIAEFAEKYPDIIKPLYETENQYSKKDGSLRRIMDAHMRGKYIAMCEGDDYWIDPHKLQKQVDFLEANPDYSMCFTSVNVISDNPSRLKESVYNGLNDREYTAEEFLKRWLIPTCTVLYRREVIDRVPQNRGFKMGDNILFATCSLLGKVWCINEKTAVYRRLESGATTKINFYVMLEHWTAFYDSFPELRDITKDLIIDTKLSILFIESKRNVFKIKMLFDIVSEFGVVNTVKQAFSMVQRLYKEYRNS